MFPQAAAGTSAGGFSNSSAPVIPNNPGEITPSDATEETQTPDPQSSDSEATTPTSSSEEEVIPSSESFDEVSSSSEAAPESSSEAESSSSVNSEYPYTLSTFPNVHCKDSSYFHKSWCPSSKPSLKQTVAEMAENEPLYGIIQPVCQDYDRTVNVYTCDNGCTYSPGAFNKLEGDTIFQQEYSTIDNKYIPIQKKIAQCSPAIPPSTAKQCTRPKLRNRLLRVCAKLTPKDTISNAKTATTTNGKKCSEARTDLSNVKTRMNNRLYYKSLTN